MTIGAGMTGKRRNGKTNGGRIGEKTGRTRKTKEIRKIKG